MDFLHLKRSSRRRSLTMCSKNVDDKLSMLPEDILSHILSLMPTIFAVRTSVLSKRWRYNWTLVTNLDIDDTYNKKILSTSVHRVMELCKSSQMQLFRLHFFKTCYDKSIVSDWIDKAVGLNVRELDIQVIKLKVPLSMFYCKTLTKLRLLVSATDRSVWEFPSSVNLPCLKTLDIAVYKNPFANAFKLIAGCPMLESLSLEVTWCDTKGDYVFYIPTLKRLKLTWPGFAAQINKVVLHVPNLEYLFVSGLLCTSFVMKDVSSLVAACVSFSKKRYDYLWVELLKGLSGVKSLSAHVSRTTLTSPLPVFLNMTHLELKGSQHFGLIPQFLTNSPQLEHLLIENVVNFFFKYKPEEFSWIEPKLVPACMLTNLTTIKFSKCQGQKCEIDFLEYMLRNAENLSTVTIICENLRIEEKKRMCAQLLNVQRASRHCEIHFL